MKWKIIVGLGNRGADYEHTYHNVGFLALDIFKKKITTVPSPLWLKPKTAMNLSGKEIKTSLKKNGVTPEELLVVHDDADIKIGSFKISFGRGSGGHKGVQSIIDELGTEKFWRLRIGTRAPETIKNERGAKRVKAGVFALAKMSKKDQIIIDELLQVLSDKLPKL